MVIFIPVDKQHHYNNIKLYMSVCVFVCVCLCVFELVCACVRDSVCMSMSFSIEYDCVSVQSAYATATSESAAATALAAVVVCAGVNRFCVSTNGREFRCLEIVCRPLKLLFPFPTFLFPYLDTFFSVYLDLFLSVYQDLLDFFHVFFSFLLGSGPEVANHLCSHT